MPDSYTLFESLELPLEPRRISIGNASVQLLPYQTLVRVSIWPCWNDFPEEQQQALIAEAFQLPAVLDTGNSGTLFLKEEHVLFSDVSRVAPRWMQDRPQRVRDAGGRMNLIPTLAAELWLHAQCPQVAAPRQLQLPVGNAGIGVYTTDRPLTGTHLNYESWEKFCNDTNQTPEAVPGPHLPVLGVRALCAGNLRIEMTFSSQSGVRVNIWMPTPQRSEAVQSSTPSASPI
jgi:hypothetical protein